MNDDVLQEAYSTSKASTELIYGTVIWTENACGAHVQGCSQVDHIDDDDDLHTGTS